MSKSNYLVLLNESIYNLSHRWGVKSFYHSLVLLFIRNLLQMLLLLSLFLSNVSTSEACSCSYMSYNSIAFSSQYKPLCWKQAYYNISICDVFVFMRNQDLMFLGNYPLPPQYSHACTHTQASWRVWAIALVWVSEALTFMVKITVRNRWVLACVSSTLLCS